VVGASTQLGDDVGGLLHDLVMHGAGVPRSVASGDAAPALGSLGAAGPGVSGLYLPDSLSFPPLPLTRGRWGTR
jgi:hypothetical protein